MTKTIEQILPPKPEARPRIYAYSIADKAHAGLLKVGQTTRHVKQRVAEQLKTAAIKNYQIELDESAERDDGTTFTDHEVRAALAHVGLVRLGAHHRRNGFGRGEDGNPRVVNAILGPEGSRDVRWIEDAPRGKASRARCMSATSLAGSSL